MYLLLDNSNEEEILFVLSVNNKSVQYQFPFEHKSLPELLSECLKKAKLKMSDIDGLAVVIGKGRFTATRLAVTFVNTLAYALQIPVVASDPDEDWPAKISAQPVGIYVSAKYSGEAHISGKQISQE